MTSEQLNKIGADVMSEWQMNFSGVELDFALEVASRAVEAEREACAKVCDSWPLSVANMDRMTSWKGNQSNAVAGAIYECGSLIRKRSNAVANSAGACASPGSEATES